MAAPRPSIRTIEIASALASGATVADIAARYDISEQRVRQIRAAHVDGGTGKAGAPRSGDFTARTAAGREALAVLVEIAEAAGWSVGDALVWLRANLPGNTSHPGDRG